MHHDAHALHLHPLSQGVGAEHESDRPRVARVARVVRVVFSVRPRSRADRAQHFVARPPARSGVHARADDRHDARLSAQRRVQSAHRLGVACKDDHTTARMRCEQCAQRRGATRGIVGAMRSDQRAQCCDRRQMTLKGREQRVHGRRSGRLRCRAHEQRQRELGRVVAQHPIPQGRVRRSPARAQQIRERAAALFASP